MRSLSVIALILVTAGCTSPGDASLIPTGSASPSTPIASAPTAWATSTPSQPAASAPTERSSSPEPVSGTAEHVEGRFRLTFTLPRTTWSSGEAISGEAALALVIGDLAELGVAGNGPLEFMFQEVGGRHVVGPAWDTVCASARLAADSPITQPIRKSGGYSNDQPDADFYRSFFADPLVRLPAGDWDISAIAEFIDGRDCGAADHHSMRATVRVHVTD
jgi:hypothetical protein